ncbi:hypothetical protein YC2023_008045 [Brassica napus]
MQTGNPTDVKHELEATPGLGEDDSSVKCQSEYAKTTYQNPRENQLLRKVIRQDQTQANQHRLGEQRRLLYDKNRKEMLPCLNTVLDYHYQR